MIFCVGRGGARISLRGLQQACAPCPHAHNPTRDGNPSTPALYVLDDEIHEAIEGGRKPDDTLQ